MFLTALIWLTGFYGTAWALDPSREINEYIHQIWLDELPQGTINAITQTPDGYLWFGTYEGLVRFDGVRFITFDKQNTPALKSNSINKLFVDHSGKLWIGTAGGGLTSFFNRQFTTYTKNDGLANDNIVSIIQDRAGNLWIGTNNGPSCYKDGKFINYNSESVLTNKSVRALYQDHEGNIWLGVEGVGLMQLNNGKFTTITTQAGLPIKLVNTIFEDEVGVLWVGTFGQGFYCRNNGQFTNITTKDGLSNNKIFTSYQDREGSLWIGTDGGGLNRFSNGRFTAYTTKDGLSHDFVRSIYQDHEGSLWVGTTNGINCFKEGKLTTFTTDHGLSNNYIRTVFQDRAGTIWVSNDGNEVSLYKDGKFSPLNSSPPLPPNTVRAICQDRQGAIWLGTAGGGLWRWQAGNLDVYPAKDILPGSYINVIFEDSKNNLWIGSTGLFRFDQGKFISYGSEDELPSSFIRTIYESRDGSLWLGTNVDGLYRFKDGKFTHYPNKAGLAYNTVLVIYEDQDGNLWIGSNGGLNRFNDGVFTTYSNQIGLFDNSIFRILEDGRNNLWLSSNKGIYQVSKNELNEYERGLRKTINSIAYGKSDGMKTNQCNGGCQPAGWKSSDGRLWFPTAKGLAMIDPEKIRLNGLAPPVVIEDVLVDGQLLDPREKITLAPGKEKFEFHYAGLSFLAPERVYFKYKLEGFDREWVDVGTRRTAYYTNIPPGDYRFRVMACNNDGVWNEIGANVQFQLLKPLWQRWWAYLCYLSIIFGGIYSGVKWRLRVLERRNRNLENIVAERTARIELQKNEIEEKNNKIIDSIKYAERIQHAILPKSENINNLLPENFILYQPKDIVSGDFYWIREVGEQIIVAVADCTGHGVPGAFMSMIGISLLNQIILEQAITDPATILKQLHVGIRQALKQVEADSENQDGMDIALCTINFADQSLTFAGARRPLYYIGDDNKLIEIKGDRQSIGGRHKQELFTNHHFIINTGMICYLTTDGFADQKGSKISKYGSTRLKLFLCDIANLKLSDQYQALKNELTSFQGEELQRDDITLIGIKVAK